MLGDWLLSSFPFLRETCVALPARERHQATESPQPLYSSQVCHPDNANVNLCAYKIWARKPTTWICSLPSVAHRSQSTTGASRVWAARPSVDLGGLTGVGQGPEHTDLVLHEWDNRRLP